MSTFDMAGEYSRHVAYAYLIGIRPMSYPQWVRANTPA